MLWERLPFFLYSPSCRQRPSEKGFEQRCDCEFDRYTRTQGAEKGLFDCS